MATTPVVAGQKLQAGSEIRVPDGKGGFTTERVSARFEPYDLTGATERSQRILALIASGEILKFDDTIVSLDKASTFLVYTKLLATNLASMEALTDGPVDLVLGEDGKPKKGKDSVAQKFNYGNDLDAKSWVSGQWRADNADPAKKIEKATKAVAAIPGLSPEQLEAINAILASAPKA